MKRVITGCTLSFCFCLITYALQATNYTWTGNVSTSWYNPGNWNPSGIPGARDNVIIVSATNQTVLDSNRSITSLTVTSGTLDLGTNTLTCVGALTANAGTIQNGTLKPRGSSASFSGTYFNCRIEANCGSINLNGSTFDKVCFLVDSSAAASTGTGGCTFNDSLIVKHAGNGQYFDMATSNGDTFNGPVTLINASNYAIRIATSGNNYFNNNLNLCSENTGGILFSKNGGTSYLSSGKNISIGGSGFRLGDLSLMNFQQLGNTSQSLLFSDSSMMAMTNCVFNGNIIVSAQGIILKNNTFHGTASFTKNGWQSYHSYGGNIFNGSTTFANVGNSGELRLATNSADAYNSDITFNNTGGPFGTSNTISVAYSGVNTFAGNVSIDNSYIFFNAGSGWVKFTGNTTQDLNGSVNYIFSNLLIDKSQGTLVANKSINIEDSLVFDSGILYTSDSTLLTFNPGSKSLGASDSSFVHGPVKKIGNTAFEFPVGKQQWLRPFSISATNLQTNSYQVEYINEPQGHGVLRDTSLEGISYCDFWSFKRIAGTDKVLVKLFWDSIHCELFDSSKATIASWDTLWRNLNVSLFSGNARKGSMISQDSVAASEADICIAYKKVSVSYTPINLTVSLSASSKVLDHFFGLNGANTIKDGSSWDNSNMRNSITRMQPSTIRFPGGTIGNWWDWRKGWFIDRDFSFQTCPGLPSSYENLVQLDNHLSTFAEAIGVIGGKPMFMLNMMTSNLPYQVAMLHEAEILGMPVNLVELGNEFYRDQIYECEPTEVFADAMAYASSSEDWITAINSRFSNADVAVIGADSRDQADVRQFNWNSNLNYSSISPAPDAATIHTYYGSGASSSNPPCEIIDYDSNNGANANSLFLSGYNYMHNIEQNEWDDLDNANLWLTEYNLWDGDQHYIHGSWAHALKTASVTFAMLERATFIKKINCHTMVSNAVFGSFFPGASDGFDFNPGDLSTQSGNFCSAADLVNGGYFPTGSFATTSLGYAMSEMGQAMRYSIDAAALVFATSGSLPSLGTVDGNNIPAIQAWQFKDNDNNERTIVLNMSSSPITIDMTASGISTPQLMKVVSLEGTAGSGNNRLNRFVFNNSGGMIDYIEFNGGSPMISNMPEQQFQTYSNSIIIPPYSLIHYVYMANGLNSVSLHASETNVCAGRNFYLYANTSPNATNFEWKNQSGTMGQTSTPFFQAQEGNGPYYVIVTYGTSGTATSNNVSITQKAIPTLTVSPSSPNFCKGGTPITLEATLTSNESPPYKYCWIPLDEAVINTDLASQLTDEIQVAPEQTSTYMVYATDGKCSVSEQVTVTVLGDILFDPNPVTFCSSSTGVTLEPSIPAGGTYLWNDNVTTVPRTVILSSPQTYTLTVTNGTCSVSASVDVIPVLCCSTAADVELLDYSYAQDFLDEANFVCSCVDQQIDGSFVVTGPLDVYIQNGLFMDLDVTLINVNLEYAERATMIVDSYRTLTLNNCTLNACSSKMWKGIQVLEKGRIITTDNTTNTETVISEAYHGILFGERTNAILRRTRFQNNFIGLQSLGSPQPLMGTYPKILSRCTFESTSPLLDRYADIPGLPANGNNGYTGIHAKNDIISINSGNPSFPSEFDNLSNGIVGENCILNVTNTTFSDMVPELNYNWLNYQGVGINLTGWERFSSLNLVGMGTGVSVNPTFNECVTGISTQTSSLRATDAKIENVIQGIRSDLPFFQAVSIVDNNISAEQNGIGIYGADFSMAVDIRDNTINIDDISNTGLLVTGVELSNMMTPFHWEHCRITCNNINMGNATRGISISGFQAGNPSRILNVAENIISIDDNSLVNDGIYFENVFNGFVQSNSVTGDDPSDANSTNAMQLLNSAENVIRLNETQNTKVGLQFMGSCNSMDNILGNSMEDHFHGMELQATGVLGIQDYTGNVWSGYDGSPIYEEDGSNPGNFIGAWADPSLNQFDLQQSRFRVNNSSALTHYPYFTPVNTDWFKPDLGSNQTFSYTNNCAILPNDPELRLGYLDSLIAEDTLTAPVYEYELRKFASLHLRDKLAKIKQTEDLDSLYSAFFNNYSSSALGRICRYRDTLQLLSPLGIDSIKYILKSDSSIHEKLYVLNEFVQLENNLPDSTLSHLTFELDVLNGIWAGSLNEIISVIGSDIYDLIDGISTSHIFDSNLKHAHMGFLYYLLERDSSGVLLEELIPIAEQCVFEGGPGVVLARNFVKLFTDTLTFDDYALCGNHRIGSVENNIKTDENFEVEIFPNPARNEITLFLSDNLINGKLKIEMLDLTGKLIFTKPLIKPQPMTLFSLPMVETGIYYIRLSGNNGFMHHQKLTIIK